MRINCHYPKEFIVFSTNHQRPSTLGESLKCGVCISISDNSSVKNTHNMQKMFEVRGVTWPHPLK
jgi:hypothetical protein